MQDFASLRAEKLRKHRINFIKIYRKLHLFIFCSLWLFAYERKAR